MSAAVHKRPRPTPWTAIRSRAPVPYDCVILDAEKNAVGQADAPYATLFAEAPELRAVLADMTREMARLFPSTAETRHPQSLMGRALAVLERTRDAAP
jgi:hypothetical protein